MSAEDVQKNKQVAQLTCQYIVEKFLTPNDIDGNMLKSYTDPDFEELETLNQIYEYLLMHGYNKGQGGEAIKKVFGEKPAYWKRKEKNQLWEQTRELLYGFDPVKVKAEYSIYKLFNCLKEAPFEVDDPTIPVYGYCKTILGGAKYFADNFASQPNPVDAFFNHFREISSDCETPEKVAQKELTKISGIGDALSLDFLKERGFTNFVKPDVHTIEICGELGYFDSDKNKNEQAIQSMKQIAQDAKITPYAVDKMFWLIGSGNFYEVENVNAADSQRVSEYLGGKNKATDRKNAFYKYMKDRL